jgi:cytochrome c peroxidase
MQKAVLQLGLVFLCFTYQGAILASEQRPKYSEAEKASILSHSPWPLKAKPDPSNRFSGNTNAIKFGYQLFHDQRLSRGNILACASCHQPDRHFMDGIPLNRGHQLLARHTPSLANLQWVNWFGWDGANDSLWAQSIRPIITPAEMDSSATEIQNLIVSDPLLSCGFRTTFGVAPKKPTSEEVLVFVGKALAAYQETLVTGISSFDLFAEAFKHNDQERMKNYAISAQRGLKIFVGKGRCSICHFGPLFTNGEFGDIGISFFVGKRKVDKGRFSGIASLQNSPFNLLGVYSDGTENDAVRTRHIKSQFRNFGEFKVPSLRNVSETAPYMHNGSLQTLRQVVDHYSELNEDRLHSEGERILRPLNLSVAEKKDLITFLKTLSAPIMVRDEAALEISGCKQ